MFTNRLSKLVIVIVIVAIALVTVSFTASPESSASYQDYAQRHSAEISAARAPDSTDYFVRHAELRTSRTADLTDYFFRQAAQ